MAKHLYIKTFGCQMNERDSEIIEQLLAQQGYKSVDQLENADLVILNTCSIRAKAEQKVFSLLGMLRKVKEKKPLMNIAVCGCVAQQEGKAIFKRMPHVSLVVGTQQIYQLPAMLSRLESSQSKKEISCNFEKSFVIPPFQKLLKIEHPSSSALSEHKKFVTIMQGCNNFCSYCVVPATRGREVSRPVADILEEVSLLVQNGVKEIILLGQNVNSYGLANSVADHQVGFADLLRLVAGITGVERLRFTSSNPQDLSSELMQCFEDLPNLCPHFHLPAQSGSNAVLQQMHRKYTRELYLEKVAALRSFCPEISLSTDIIIGFPGETEQDFEQTMDLLNQVRFHGSFSFKYSDRPHTRSAEFSNKVDESVKGERLQQFQRQQGRISLERNKELVGKTVEVMVEQVHDSSVQARTGSNHIVHFPLDYLCKPGDLVNVKLVRAGKLSLNGDLIER
jgi:tRNA-2-methylthio-N6-dimethylallyladenosine synthase